MPRLRTNYKFTVLHTQHADYRPSDDAGFLVEVPASESVDNPTFENEAEKVRVKKEFHRGLINLFIADG